MYDFTGCECPICHQHFKIDSDVVVCPDCGTPYHRDCYQSLGHCKFQNAHSDTFEWQPPEKIKRSTMLHCPRCETENEKSNEYCKHCGLSFAELAENTNDEKEKKSTLTSSFVQKKDESVDTRYHGLPLYGKPLNLNETFEEIPVAEWISYIGTASPAYLTNFQQMKLRNRKYSFSFSAMLFGPLYFFYRKTWGWALAFSLIAILLNIPAFLTVLIYSESAYAPVIGETTLNVLSQASVAISWAVIMLRGLYANHIYQKAAAKSIKKIKARAKSAKEKTLLLQMYGGTSIAAVMLAIVTAIVIANGFSVLLGPEFDAVLEMLYY
ncbi:MAG: RING finger protein [Faecalibacterium sp.]